MNYKSTKADERFFHMSFRPGEMQVGPENKPRELKAVTGFARQIDGVWYASVAECDARDQFCRKQGRSTARRKFFLGKRKQISEPTHAQVLRRYLPVKLESDLPDLLPEIADPLATGEDIAQAIHG